MVGVGCILRLGVFTGCVQETRVAVGYMLGSRVAVGYVQEITVGSCGLLG